MKLVRDDVRLYLITGTVDMRMGIDGYIAVVQNRLHMNVFDNSIFLFCNKDHSKLNANAAFPDAKRRPFWYRLGGKALVPGKTGRHKDNLTLMMELYGTE